MIMRSVSFGKYASNALRLTTRCPRRGANKRARSKSCAASSVVLNICHVLNPF
jgi:hypothetical protein